MHIVSIDIETFELATSAQFYLRYNKGEFLAFTNVRYAWSGSGNIKGKRSKHDWAIARLAEPLGQEFGYFGVRALENLNENKKIKIIGYGSEFTDDVIPTIQKQCVHDCFS